MRNSKFLVPVLGSVFAVFFLVLAPEVRAELKSGTPWDWEGWDKITSNRGNSGSQSMCDSLAENLEIPSLQCPIDHASWDAYYRTEMQKPESKRFTDRSPVDCTQSAFNFLREKSANGHFPDRAANDATAGKAIDDFKSKVGSIVCKLDDTTKPLFLTYDAASKALIFHLTRADLVGPYWVGPELQKMSKEFPGINQYWSEGHDM